MKELFYLSVALVIASIVMTLIWGRGARVSIDDNVNIKGSTFIDLGENNNSRIVLFELSHESYSGPTELENQNMIELRHFFDNDMPSYAVQYLQNLFKSAINAGSYITLSSILP